MDPTAGNAMRDRSAQLFDRAQQYLVGGVSRNTLLRTPHPVYVAEASGCRVVDVDGVERLDFANNMAALIHGHAFPPVVAAVGDQLQRGSAFSLATEVEIDLAEHLCGRSPGFDKIRFVNSGTEAVMAAIKAARAFTGRSRIAKVEGTYHGAYDYAEVSQEPTPEDWGVAHRPTSVPLASSTPESIAQDVIVLPYNRPEEAIARLDEHRDEIACVLLDLMPHRSGLVPASEAFVSALRRWTRDNDALLVCDEVITFRLEVGGMQARHGVEADLTALGKAIGGGHPVGALAGREDVMAVFSHAEGRPRLPHSGTFSGNPVSMTAGLVAMRHYDSEAVTRLNQLGSRARLQVEEAISVSRVPASVTGDGSLFRLHLKEKAPADYRDLPTGAGQRDALHQFIDGMYDAGIVVIHSGLMVLSTAMAEPEVDRLADGVLASLRKIDPSLHR